MKESLINLLELNGHEIVGVYDDNFQEQMRGEQIENYQLLGGLDEIDPSSKFVIAKGNCKALKQLSQQLDNQLLKDNLIHPKAIIETAKIGSSNHISAQAYIAKSSQIGDSNIIYSNSSIEHEVEMGNYNVLTVNVTICGRVKIGNGCFFGASSAVLPILKISDGAIIEAGAVVIEDITEAGTYVGVPAKKLIK